MADASAIAGMEAVTGLLQLLIAGDAPDAVLAAYIPDAIYQAPELQHTLQQVAEQHP